MTHQQAVRGGDGEVVCVCVGYSVVWCGTVWYGVVWASVVWYGVVQCGMLGNANWTTAVRTVLRV